MLDKKYVLAPFQELLDKCRNTVLFGLRILEKIDVFPEPTQEELVLLQFSTGHVGDVVDSKAVFKKWLLLTGFQDIHLCLRSALERLYVFKTSEKNVLIDGTELEKKLEKVSQLKLSDLLQKINSVADRPIEYKEHIDSINMVRNCLAHSHGIVADRFCNDKEEGKLIISGSRFKFFYRGSGGETVADFGKQGPENTSLNLSAEDFKMEFLKGQEITFSLREFFDILSTCIFIRADIGVLLERNN